MRNTFALLAGLLGMDSAMAGYIHRKCQFPDVQQNFDTEAYLGNWYEQYRDKSLPYEHGTCTTAGYSFRDDGDIRVLNNDYNESKQEWGGGVGKAFLVDPSKDEGYLKVKFVVFQPNADYKVIATDYETYTVIYTCFALPLHVYGQEFVWVLTRDTEMSAEIEAEVRLIIKNAVPLYDLEENWQPTKQGGDCPYQTAPTSVEDFKFNELAMY
jgi:apolipoprotein D and lipocalin family protein